MGDGDHFNHLEAGRMWDDQGLEWTTKRAAWLTLAQADSLVRRANVRTGLADRGLTWMTGEETRLWWQHARRHFEVPGSGAVGRPDDLGQTWGGHAWRRGADRVLVFHTFC